MEFGSMDVWMDGWVADAKGPVHHKVAGCVLSCTRSLIEGQGKCLSWTGSGSFQYVCCTPSYYGVLFTASPQQSYNTMVACVRRVPGGGGVAKDTIEVRGQTRQHLSDHPMWAAALACLLVRESQAAQTLAPSLRELELFSPPGTFGFGGAARLPNLADKSELLVCEPHSH